MPLDGDLGRADVGREGGEDVVPLAAQAVVFVGLAGSYVPPKTSNGFRTMARSSVVAVGWRTYAHVVRQDDERVRTIVDETLGGDAEDWLRTETG
jgi:hypothetical protein